MKTGQLAAIKIMEVTEVRDDVERSEEPTVCDSATCLLSVLPCST